MSVAFAAVPVAPGSKTMLPFEGARQAIVSWNSTAAEGEIRVRAFGRDGSAGERLRLARWSPAERRSFSERDAAIDVEVDIVRARVPISSLEIETEAPLDLLAMTTCDERVEARPHGGRAIDLPVPPRSQFPDDLASVPPRLARSARGWCSAASLAMVLEYYGRPMTLVEVASRVFDSAFGGTGNWSFNVAFAGSLGFRAHVAYLRDLRAAEEFVARGIPLAVTYSWRRGDLPGAPQAESSGHFSVLRGFDALGNPLLNDPAQPALRAAYPRSAFEAVWLRHGGVAYVVAPPEEVSVAGEFAASA